MEYPDGKKTLCLIPAKFLKKIWIKRGTYLIIDMLQSDDAKRHAVTGQIAQVLYADHVKQLQRMGEGIWPYECKSDHKVSVEETSSPDIDSIDMRRLNLDSEDEKEPSNSLEDQRIPKSQGAVNSKGIEDSPQVVGGAENTEVNSEYSSDDSLPPLPKIQNRKIIEYEISDSDSD